MDMEDTSKLKIFTGNSHPALAKEISDYIGVPLGKAICGKFNNGEIQVMINESVRGKDCFIIQPTGAPVNDNLMEMLIMIDALKRASARHITCVVPYYGYARQDRKTRGREPISSKLVADLMSAAGATRVVTMDLHAGQIQGFFNVPVDHLMSASLLADYVKSKNLENLTIVSPDLGGVTRARELADRVGAPIAIIEKRRPEPGVAKVMNIIGDVKDRNCFVVDDIVDTAGSLCEGAKALAEAGDPEAIAERDAMLAKDAEARKRKKKRYAERMANDPEYAEKIRQRQRAYNKAHADKRKADYADLIKRAETDPEAARKLAEIRAYQSRKTVERYQNLVERAKTDPAAAEKLAQKRQKQNESAKAAYNHLKEQAKTDPEAAKKLEERRSKQRKATNKYLEKRKNNVQEDNAA